MWRVSRQSICCRPNLNFYFLIAIRTSVWSSVYLYKNLTNYEGMLIASKLPLHPSTLNLFFQAALSSNIHLIVISSLWTGFLWNCALHINLNSFQISDSKLYLNLCFPLNFNHPLSLLFIHTWSSIQTFNFLQMLLFTTLQYSTVSSCDCHLSQCEAQQ